MCASGKSKQRNFENFAKIIHFGVRSKICAKLNFQHKSTKKNHAPHGEADSDWFQPKNNRARSKGSTPASELGSLRGQVLLDAVELAEGGHEGGQLGVGLENLSAKFDQRGQVI